MKLIEHLEHVIGLVGKSTPAEIKGALLAMHEEVEGQQQATQNYLALVEAKAKVDAELASLKKPSTPTWGSQPRIKGRMER